MNIEIDRFISAQTKCPETKRPEGKKVLRKNVQRHSTHGTKCPEGQNFRKDKTFGRTKHPEDRTSMGTKRSKTKHSFGLFSIHTVHIKNFKYSASTKRPTMKRPSTK
jgi:hypothetical protein